MACPVCYSAADPLVRGSLNAGILVLLGVTASVLACLARFMWLLARRSARIAHEATEGAAREAQRA